MFRLKNKIFIYLKQGMSPRDITMAISLAIVLGTFPVIGATSVLCGLVGLVLRLNVPLVQAVNWVVSPLQVVLIIPFFKAGSSLFGGNQVNVTLTEILNRMKADFIGTIQDFMVVTIKAVGVWSLVAPVAGILIFMITMPVVMRLHLEYVRMKENNTL